MSKFRCFAAGCGLENDRRLPPPGCLDNRRCDFRQVAGTAASAAQKPAVLSTPAQPEAPPLAAIIGTSSYPLRGTTVLGRNGTLAPEQFRSDLGVSRAHCRIELVDFVWTLTALSLSSPTTLNGRLLPVHEPVEVPLGTSTLTLGESFIITLHHEACERPAAVPAGGELDRLLRGGT